MIGVKSMPDEEKLVKALSLQERKEAVESHLDWLDQQKAVLDDFYQRNIAELNRQREQASSEMRKIAREEMKGRSE
jgi:hypothetical protein